MLLVILCLPRAAAQAQDDVELSPRLAALVSELAERPPHELKLELAYLRSHRPRIGPPFALISAGGLTFVTSMALAGFGFAYNLGLGDDRSARELARDFAPLWIVAGVGAAVTVAGGLWLRRRLKARRPCDARMRALMVALGR